MPYCHRLPPLDSPQVGNGFTTRLIEQRAHHFLTTFLRLLVSGWFRTRELWSAPASILALARKWEINSILG